MTTRTDLRSELMRSLRFVDNTQQTAITRAASSFADVVARGGIVHCFGTGHSRIVALELCGRAGGLASFTMIGVKDLVMFGGAEPAGILNPTCERDADLGRRVFDLAGIDRGDALLAVSNSGRNAAAVELVSRAAQLEIPIVAITSRRHSRAVSSGHPSGRHVHDFAQVVIDNGAPLGDAPVTLPSLAGTGAVAAVGAVSSLTGVYLAQLLQAGICDALRGRGLDPPVLTSQNTSEGDHRNAALYARYPRVRPIEP